MSAETRKDLVLLTISFIAATVGITSVFVADRPFAWIANLISDSYLFFVLLFAAILSDDDTLAIRHPWITGLFLDEQRRYSSLHCFSSLSSRALRVFMSEPGFSIRARRQ